LAQDFTVRKVTHLVVLAAFMFSCGGHWCIFQAVAWAKMIREYSTMVPVAEAVSMTFSGKYPCAICQAIAEKKSSEQQKVLALEKYDKKFLPLAATALFQPSVAAFKYGEVTVILRLRSESPPTPPPRLVLS
jgi:hypothetical protein